MSSPTTAPPGVETKFYSRWSDRPLITPDRLREVLAYDPVTGVFRWKVRTSKRVHIGDVAGRVGSNGYRGIGIDGERPSAHRLAWLYVHGEWPEGKLDHRNGVRDDNRIANLREATTSQNGQNVWRPRRHNRSGLLGVKRCRSKWQARIRVDGVGHHLGTFQTPEAAAAAYLAAKREMHPFWEAP